VALLQSLCSLSDIDLESASKGYNTHGLSTHNKCDFAMIKFLGAMLSTLVR
jgi:hypothetical protein